MENISNTVDIRQLRHFMAVAEEHNFRRAAERLGMAQPPLTQSIRKLEDGIGAQLFDRSQRPVRLTEAGRTLLPEARTILAQLAASVRKVQRASQGIVGTLRITHVGSAAFEFLPALIRAYRKTHPEVDLELRERTTAAQLAALHAGTCDVGFVRPPVFAGADLCCEIVRRERLVAALPETHPLARRRRVRLMELAHQPFIMFPAREGPSFYARIVSACEHAGFSMRVVQEAVQMHAIVSLVAAGLGVALVPASMRNLRHPGVVYRDVSGDSGRLSAELGVVWRKHQDSPVIDGFLEQIRNL